MTIREQNTKDLKRAWKKFLKRQADKIVKRLQRD